MIVISSTSGRTLALQENTCGGLSVTVCDGRQNGRSILLDREGAKQLSDALAAWLQSSQPHELNMKRNIAEALDLTDANGQCAPF
jgi:hypothetical protein